MADLKCTPNNNEERNISVTRMFHGESPDPQYWPGVENCEHVNCEICSALKRQLDPTDTFRHGTPNAQKKYYSGSIRQGPDGKYHYLHNE